MSKQMIEDFPEEDLTYADVDNQLTQNLFNIDLKSEFLKKESAEQFQTNVAKWFVCYSLW